MSDDILDELRAEWVKCACYEGSLSVDQEVIDQAAAEIERLRARIAQLEIVEIHAMKKLLECGYEP
jgi:hypothetical protein